MRAPVIVICDDEADLVSELAEWFESQGWSVFTAKSAKEALMLLARGGRTTCLVIDKRMPLLDGDVVAQHVGALPPSERPDLVAVMTGDFSMQGSPRPGGVDMVFIKPVDPHEMLTAIAEQLKARIGAPLRLSPPGTQKAMGTQ